MTVRLFQLYDTEAKKAVEGFYASKVFAKEKRKELNSTDTNGKEIFRYVVVPGPDHHRYKEHS